MKHVSNDGILTELKIGEVWRCGTTWTGRPEEVVTVKDDLQRASQSVWSAKAAVKKESLGIEVVKDVLQKASQRKMTLLVRMTSANCLKAFLIPVWHETLRI